MTSQAMKTALSCAAAILLSASMASTQAIAAPSSQQQGGNQGFQSPEELWKQAQPISHEQENQGGHSSSGGHFEGQAPAPVPGLIALLATAAGAALLRRKRRKALENQNDA